LRGTMAEEEKTAGNTAQEAKMHPSFVNVIRQRERLRAKLGAIKHKIGIYSAKGGVGKTTVAVNIAFTLERMGFKVGLLDADIDTPNISLFLGIEEKMELKMPLMPLEKGGVKVASTAMIVNDAEKPIVWRGPMIAKMLGDFFENTEWGALDYLIIDLPPGTSDAPLTIMQLLELDGFVIVTTPQRIASVNSIRSGLMAKRLNSSLLGVIENMSEGKIGPNTQNVVDALGVALIGTIEVSRKFNELSDQGKVPVLEDDAIYGNFRQIVKTLPGEFDKVEK
jgi:ATP-binding protein involved in chromosome partitioning